MQNNNMVGINVAGMKKLSLDLIDYCEEFKKIKSTLDNIENKLKNNFSGEAGNNYSNSFKSFINNFDYVSASMRIYSDYCQEIIKKYERHDSSVI